MRLILPILFLSVCYPDTENFCDSSSEEDFLSRDIVCSDYAADPFLFYVCDSIYNKIIQKKGYTPTYDHSFVVPSTTYLDSVVDFLSNLNISNISAGDSELDLLGYKRTERDFNNDGNTYHILHESTSASDGDYTNGSGIFILNPNPQIDNSFIHVNHPHNDLRTIYTGAKLFRESGAKWLFIAGAHRYSDIDSSNYSDTDCTTQCGECSADMARTTCSVFQNFHKILSNNPVSRSLSIHGFNTDSIDINIGTMISNGVDSTSTTDNKICIPPTNFTQRVKNEIISLSIWNDTNLSVRYDHPCMIAYEDIGTYPELYTGSPNPQGIWTNSSEGQGDWLHLEIESCLRTPDYPNDDDDYICFDSDDRDEYQDSIVTALSRAFSEPHVINIPTDYSTIQQGIDAAIDGDTVLVAAGTYTENINFNGKNIVVQGADRETTIIDGNQSGSVVTFESGENSTTALSGFTITNGEGFYAGGILCNAANPTLNNLKIMNCHSTSYTSNAGGGGIGCYNISSQFISNVIFINNSSEENGASFYSNGCSDIHFDNIIIAGNQSPYGIISIAYEGSGHIFTNISIINNTVVYGGLIDGEPQLINSIVWNNNPQYFFNPEMMNPPNPIVIYSNIEGGWEGEGNIDSNPYFIDSANGNYRLSDYSPCIGAGTLDGAPTTDIEGNPRPNPAGSNPDMGAYENALGTYLHNPSINVATTGNDTGSVGLSSAPFATIQAAIDYSEDGDTVLVADGTYTENINFNGKNIAVIGEDRETTIIDGSNNTLQNGGSIACFVNGETNDAKLENFTLSGGTGYRLGNEPDNDGTYYYGGGIYCYNSHPTLINLRIYNNNVNASGGGISINQANPMIDNIIIDQNHAQNNGGGISLYNSSNPILTNVSITNNSTNQLGGGIYCRESSSMLNNTIISNNSSDYGGGIYSNDCDLSMTNLTISNNTASSFGGVCLFNNGGSPTVDIINSIIDNNQIGFQSNSTPPTTLNISYSNIQGSWEGEGNIDLDPQFVSPYSSSPEIDPDLFTLGWIVNDSTVTFQLYIPDEYDLFIPYSGWGEWTAYSGSSCEQDDYGGMSNIQLLNQVNDNLYEITNDLYAMSYDNCNGVSIGEESYIPNQFLFLGSECQDIHGCGQWQDAQSGNFDSNGINYFDIDLVGNPYNPINIGIEGYALRDYSPCIGAGTTSGAPTTDIVENPRPNPAESNPDMGVYENSRSVPLIYTNDDYVSINEDTDSTIWIAQNDLNINWEEHSLGIVEAPSHGTAVIVPDSLIIYTPTQDYFGSDQIKYSIGDGTESDSATIYINVLPVNDAPELTSIDNQAIEEDGQLTLTAQVIDIDSEILTLEVSENANYSVTIDGFSFTIDSNADYNGEIEVEVSVSDEEYTVTETFTLTVNPVNDAPGIDIPDTFEFDEDGLLAIDFSPYVNDIDSDTSLVLTAADNDHIDIDIETFQVTFTADTNWNGYEDIAFTIDDQDLRFTASDIVRVSVLPINDAPIITELDSVIIDEDNSTEVTVSAFDVDEDTLEFSASSDTIAVSTDID
ncbi:tandem-95 repeat protein [Candidatus Marinimicrobia bacterium PRS2]|nr:tandem-95 repeat protein [Candidatus Marinimicrobia bacterium PRS2]